MLKEVERSWTSDGGDLVKRGTTPDNIHKLNTAYVRNWNKEFYGFVGGLRRLVELSKGAFQIRFNEEIRPYESIPEIMTNLMLYKRPPTYTPGDYPHWEYVLLANDSADVWKMGTRIVKCYDQKALITYQPAYTHNKCVNDVREPRRLISHLTDRVIRAESRTMPACGQQKNKEVVHRKPTP